jgi:DNA recombination protein RmuC
MPAWAYACAGLALGGVFVWLWLRGREAALQARLDAALPRLGQLEDRLAAAEAERAALDRALASTQADAEARLATLRDAHERLTAEFKSLSADALRVNRDDFLRLAGESFARLQEAAAGELEKRQQAVASLVDPLRERLQKVDTALTEIEKTRASAHSALAEQLRALGLAQASLQQETTRLATALSGTRTAGTWGELQLRRVVELAGMVEHCDFSEQESAGDQRPDLVVRLPREQTIVVDAKAPTDAFREAAAATDPAVRAAKLAEHAAKVRGHIDALAARAYWERFQPSPEFVVLFLPGDQFLAAALEADPAIVDRGIRGRVLLATPSTLVALLKAAAYGWRQEAVSQNAEEIARLGRELYDRIATFAEHLERTGRGLDQATRAYNAAVGSFESALLPGARKFTELGARGAKTLPEPPPIENTVREIAKRS